MASSKLAARGIRNHAKYKGRNDLNIVPMIDMMVILVFFLIFTAVFTKTNVLELNLPGADSAVPDSPSRSLTSSHRPARRSDFSTIAASSALPSASPWMRRPRRTKCRT